MNRTTKIYLKESPGKGMGVYAAVDIKQKELIEKCYLIPVNTKPSELGLLYDYVFNYPQEGDFKTLVLPTGAGCVYNHDDNHNAYWIDSTEPMHFDYIAKRNIKKDEEICTHYGDQYWVQMADPKPNLKKKTND